MTKAAYAKLEGIDVEALHDILHRDPAHRWKVPELVDLIMNHPEHLHPGFVQKCQRKGLHDVALALIQTIDVCVDDSGTRQARLFHHVEKEEIKVVESPDGSRKERRVKHHEFVGADGLTLSEWDEVLREQEQVVHKAKRRANSTVLLFNGIARRKGWEQRSFLFPESESHQD